MKELLHIIKGNYFIRPEHNKRLKEYYRVKVGRGSEGIFLIFYSLNLFEEFKREFYIPEDFVIVLQEFAQNQTFVHYSRKVDMDLVFQEGLVSKKNGFLGQGIYGIHEDDFLNNGIGDRNIVKILMEHNMKKKGVYLGSSMVLFNYSGPIMTVIHGKNRENITRLITHAITEDKVISIIDESIEYEFA